MTVESVINRAQYATNGTTGPFTVPFYFLEDSHLQVIHTDDDGNETALTLTTHYSVAGAGDPNGGTVTTVASYAAGGYITILRDVPLLQQTDYVETDAFPAEAHEEALDRQMMILQQLREVVDRALVFSPSDTAGSALPAAAARASKLLGFDSNGVLMMSVPVDGSAASLAALLASTANASDGAGMSGYGPSRAYVHETVGGRLNESVSFSKFLTATQKSDIEAGTLLQDCTTAWQNAADSGEVIELIAGNIRINGNVVSSVVPRMRGKGRSKTIFHAYASSGNVFEFNNAAGSYDEGLILEGFSIVGQGTGSAVGLKIEGAVYANSRLRDILVKSMGSHGVYVDDCLTMVMEGVRAQLNGGTGILIDQSNGIELWACMAESNVAKGIYLNDGGAAFGENFGGGLFGCHAEENGEDAVYIKGHYGIGIHGGWFQCKGPGTYGAITLDAAQHCRIVGPTLSSGGTVTNLAGVRLLGALHNHGTVYCYGFAANRDIVGDSSSGRNHFAGTGNAAQGGLSWTDASSTGNSYENWAGSGGSYGREHFAGYHSFRSVDGTERFRADANGVSLLGHTTSTSATGGAATALPAQPTGYVTININGTNRKVAYY